MSRRFRQRAEKGSGEATESLDDITAMYDRLKTFIATRPDAVRVSTADADVPEAYLRLLRGLGDRPR